MNMVFLRTVFLYCNYAQTLVLLTVTLTQRLKMESVCYVRIYVLQRSGLFIHYMLLTLPLLLSTGWFQEQIRA